MSGVKMGTGLPSAATENSQVSCRVQRVPRYHIDIIPALLDICIYLQVGKLYKATQTCSRPMAARDR